MLQSQQSTQRGNGQVNQALAKPDIHELVVAGAGASQPSRTDALDGPISYA